MCGRQLFRNIDPDDRQPGLLVQKLRVAAGGVSMVHELDQRRNKAQHDERARHDHQSQVDRYGARGRVLHFNNPICHTCRSLEWVGVARDIWGAT
jgi:hypothetical protein